MPLVTCLTFLPLSWTQAGDPPPRWRALGPLTLALCLAWLQWGTRAAGQGLTVVFNPSGPNGTTNSANYGPTYVDDPLNYTNLAALLSAIPSGVQTATIEERNCGQGAFTVNPWTKIPNLTLKLHGCSVQWRLTSS